MYSQNILLNLSCPSLEERGACQRSRSYVKHIGIYLYVGEGGISVFMAQEPKAPVTYCDHALSGVRPSSVVR